MRPLPFGPALFSAALLKDLFNSFKPKKHGVTRFCNICDLKISSLTSHLHGFGRHENSNNRAKKCRRVIRPNPNLPTIAREAELITENYVRIRRKSSFRRVVNVITSPERTCVGMNQHRKSHVCFSTQLKRFLKKKASMTFIPVCRGKRGHCFT